MATIQCKVTRGRKYWYIVESRRINGKPRPVVVAYLGKAEDLLNRLSNAANIPSHIKSYSHGLIHALCAKAGLLGIVEIINRYVESNRGHVSKKPILNGLTVGETIVLAAIGRACRPTSKRNWSEWAVTTSLSYLLKTNLKQLDSQHFWDHMDCLPVESLEKIESDLIANVWKNHKIKTDTLLFDTTNFFTYIDSENKRCTIAKRGKNKQKRMDLRQIGYALVVSREDHIPLFQHTYEGNQVDCTTFQKVMAKIKSRILELGLDFSQHTFVFDKGMPTKKNFILLDSLECSYVTSVKQCTQKDLISSFEDKAEEIFVNGDKIRVLRSTKKIYGKDRTVVVYLSERLKNGMTAGIAISIEKRLVLLQEVRNQLHNTKRKVNRKKKKLQIEKIIGKDLQNVIEWRLIHAKTKWDLQYSVNDKKKDELEEKTGFKILVSDRDAWSSAEIIQAYNGQAAVEEEFKNTKNPFHLAIRPQYHWTDQKIRVHFMACFISHLLTRLLYKEAREKLQFSGQLNTLLEKLNSIRVASYLTESSKKTTKKSYALTYSLEEQTPEQKKLTKAFSITAEDDVTKGVFGVGVYK